MARWRSQQSLDRLFSEAEGGLDASGETGVGPAPPETVALWVKAMASMGPDELESFERRTFATWGRPSLGNLRRAIERRGKELGGGGVAARLTLWIGIAGSLVTVVLTVWNAYTKTQIDQREAGLRDLELRLKERSAGLEESRERVERYKWCALALLVNDQLAPAAREVLVGPFRGMLGSRP